MTSMPNKEAVVKTDNGKSEWTCSSYGNVVLRGIGEADSGDNRWNNRKKNSLQGKDCFSLKM